MVMLINLTLLASVRYLVNFRAIAVLSKNLSGTYNYACTDNSRNAPVVNTES